MSTNLLILPSDFLVRGNKNSLPSGASSYAEENLILGSRQKRFRSASTTTAINIEANVSNLPEPERQANFVYFAGLRLTTDRVASSVDLGLYGSDDNFSTTKVSSEALNITSGVLSGVNGEDYVIIDDDLEPANYWRVRLSNSPDPAVTYELRKVFFGRYVDLGVEPEVPLEMRVLEAPNGRQMKRLLTLRWRNVTNAKIKEFEDRVLQFGCFPIALCTRSYGYPLNNEGLFYCKVKSHQIVPALYNKNNLTVQFQEEI